MHERVGQLLDDQLVHLGQQVGDHINFPGNLGPAHNGHKGPFRILERFSQIIQFFHHQIACRTLPEMTRHPFRGCMGSMCGPEGIVDIDVAQFGKFFGKGRIVIGLLFVVPQIFQYQYVAATKRFDRCLSRFADAVLCECNRFPQQVAQYRHTGF